MGQASGNRRVVACSCCCVALSRRSELVAAPVAAWLSAETAICVFVAAWCEFRLVTPWSSMFTYRGTTRFARPYAGLGVDSTSSTVGEFGRPGVGPAAAAASSLRGEFICWVFLLSSAVLAEPVRSRRTASLEGTATSVLWFCAIRRSMGACRR